MNTKYFVPVTGPSSSHPSIPFFQIQEVSNPFGCGFSRDGNVDTVIINHQKGFVKIVKQLDNEPVAFGAGVHQRWEWEYTQDINEASRFRSTEATRYFQEYCGGPRRGNHSSSMLVKHAQSKVFPVFA